MAKGTVSLSPISKVAISEVTNGSAKRNELVTAGPASRRTRNQMQYPIREHVVERKRTASHPVELRVKKPEIESSIMEIGIKNNPPMTVTFATRRKGLYLERIRLPRIV